MTLKSALITGLTGQDGSYLAELLLGKGYRVRGLVRRSSSFNTARIDHLFQSFSTDRFDYFRADLTDGGSLGKIFRNEHFDEVYHLGAQSHVAVSFEMPEYTLDTTVMGTIRLFEALRAEGAGARIYVACSSEMFGATPPPQNEASPMRPRSPYAIGKHACYELALNYREAYGLSITNGILFNHESPRRGETFVTRKISIGVARIVLGLQGELVLGNLDAERDWGYAGDYVEAMWRMLQHEQPDDFVVATGESYSVRDFCELAFAHVGLDWREFVRSDSRYFRPTEVERLRGDYSKARSLLGWEPSVDLPALVAMMVDADVAAQRRTIEGTGRPND